MEWSGVEWSGGGSSGGEVRKGRVGRLRQREVKGTVLEYVRWMGEREEENARAFLGDKFPQRYSKKTIEASLSRLLPPGTLLSERGRLALWYGRVGCVAAKKPWNSCCFTILRLRAD